MKLCPTKTTASAYLIFAYMLFYKEIASYSLDSEVKYSYAESDTISDEVTITDPYIYLNVADNEDIEINSSYTYPERLEVLPLQKNYIGFSNAEKDTDTPKRMGAFNFSLIPREKRSDTPKKHNIPATLPPLPKSFLKDKEITLTNKESGLSLRDEEEKHPGDPNYCHTCDILFRYDGGYTKHCKEWHGYKKPFVCRYCGRRFIHKRSLIKHVDNIHDDVKENPYVRYKKFEAVFCQICLDNFDGHKAFEHHALTAHAGIQMMICPHCSMRFFRRAALLKHVQKHMELQLKCKFCENVFERTDALKIHEEYCKLMQHQRNDTVTKDANSMKMNPNPCAECGIHFQWFNQLEDHYREYHPEKRLHACKYCEESFYTDIGMDTHVDFHHAGEAGVLEIKRGPRGDVYKCKYCDERYCGILDYEIHGTTEHPGRPLFFCQKCPKDFLHKNSLRGHMKQKHGKV